MVTTVYEQRGGTLQNLCTWVQAAGLVYLIVLGVGLLGAAVVLPVLGVIELVSWVAALRE
jgi:hypothetical protein